MPSPFVNNICAVLAFVNSMVHIEFKVAGCIPERLAYPDKHECTRVAQLHVAWNTAVAFCNSTNFLQCDRKPA